MQGRSVGIASVFLSSTVLHVRPDATREQGAGIITWRHGGCLRCCMRQGSDVGRYGGELTESLSDHDVRCRSEHRTEYRGLRPVLRCQGPSERRVGGELNGSRSRWSSDWVPLYRRRRRSFVPRLVQRLLYYSEQHTSGGTAAAPMSDRTVYSVYGSQWAPKRACQL